jgi:hypothetical protein
MPPASTDYQAAGCLESHQRDHLARGTAMEKLRIVAGLATEKWSLNDGQIPNRNVARVATRYGVPSCRGKSTGVA